MNRQIKIGITGAKGYVGNILKESLQHNYEILCLNRTKENAEDIYWSLELDENKMYEIIKDLGITHIIHAAWPMHSNDEPANNCTGLNGTINLLNACEQAGIDNFYFISTISAFEGAVSIYGKSKFYAEKFVLSKNKTVLRLGLVCDNKNKKSGIFNTIKKQIMSSSIVPLINGGGMPLYLCPSMALCSIIENLIKMKSEDILSPVTIACANFITLKDMVMQICIANNRKRLFVSVPWYVVYFALKFSEIIKLKFSAKSDSILGLVFYNHNVVFPVIPELVIQEFCLTDDYLR